jgi:hypothetical protein
VEEEFTSWLSRGRRILASSARYITKIRLYSRNVSVGIEGKKRCRQMIQYVGILGRASAQCVGVNEILNSKHEVRCELGQNCALACIEGRGAGLPIETYRGFGRRAQCRSPLEATNTADRSARVLIV